MTNLLRLIRPKKNLEQRVLSAQTGNLDERNALIHEYSPFIKKILSQQLGRYIEEENEAHYAEGLEAFNDAIDGYRQERGGFLAFASTVIRNRTIDELRKENRQQQELPLSSLDSNEGEGIQKLEQEASVRTPEEEVLIQEELQTLIHRLRRVGITLDDLIREAPKHKDTRRRAIQAARFVHESQAYRNLAISSGKLPLKELARHYGMSNKAVNRSKKYILAVIMVLDSDLDIMKGYIGSLEGSLERGD